MKILALTLAALVGCSSANFDLATAAAVEEGDSDTADAAELGADGEEPDDGPLGDAGRLDTGSPTTDSGSPSVDTATSDSGATSDTRPAADTAPAVDTGSGSPPLTYPYPVFGDDWTPGGRPENQLGILGDYVKGSRSIGAHSKATLTLMTTPSSTHSITVAFLIDGKKFDEKTLSTSDTSKTFVAAITPDMFSAGHWFELRVTGCSPICGASAFKIANSSSTLRFDP